VSESYIKQLLQSCIITLSYYTSQQVLFHSLLILKVLDIKNI